MRVLVADDDRVMSQLLCAMLEAAGHKAIPAFDGASTLMAAMRTPAPDLIVLDLAMPAGDGPTTLTKLKASSKTALIPVLVVSGSPDAGAHDSVRALGAAAYLQKPVSADTFIDAVEAFGREK
jgi:two-component system cell cycle response regulator DivK